MLEKCNTILGTMSSDRNDWLEQYTELHKSNELFSNQPISGLSAPLFPIVRKIAAKTIGLDLVEVKPMSPPGGTSKEEMDRIIAETKAINRNAKLDNILEDKEFQEVDIKDHPDYKGPSGMFFYMDMQYGSTSSTP